MSSEYRYDVDLSDERFLCRERPLLYVTVTERRTETWHEHDGATVTKEHPPRVIATFEVDPSKGERQ